MARPVQSASPVVGMLPCRRASNAVKGQQKQTPVPSAPPREVVPPGPSAASSNSDALAAMAAAPAPADPDLLGLAGGETSWKGEGYDDSGDGTVTHDDHTLSTEGYTHETGTTSTWEDGATRTDTESTTWGWGSLSWASETGRTLDSADPEGSADAVRKALTEKADHLDRQRAGLDSALATLDAQLAPFILSPEEQAHAEVATLGVSRDALLRQREALAADAAAARADAGAVSVENAAELARAHGVYAPEVTDTTGATTKKSESWDWNPFDDDGVGVENESSTTTDGAGDAKSTHTETSSTKVAVGEGIALTHSQGSSDEIQIGDASSKRSQKSSVTGGLVATESGAYGVKAGASREQTDDGLTTEYGGNGQITTDGLSGDASAGVKNKASEHVTVGAKTSATGNFTVVIAKAADGRYELVVTIAAGASLALSGEAEGGEKPVTGKGSASVSGTASVNGAMVFVHTLSAREAELYLGKLEAADKGKPSGDEPEFSLLAKLAVLGSQAFEDDAGAAALLDASAARGLGSGDSVRIALSAKGNVEGKASGSYAGLGASAEGSRSTGGSVTYGVKRVQGADGRPRIEVTAGFTADSAWKRGGGLSGGIASTGASVGGSQSSGYTATFLLDPDAAAFDLQYNRIMHASSESELRALEKDRDVLAARSKAVTNVAASSSEGHTAGLGPISGAFDATSRESRVTTESAKGTSTTFTGQRATNLSLAAGPVSIGEERTDSAVGTVDETGDTDLRIVTKTGNTRLAPGVDDDVALGDALVNAPAETVKGLLTETDTALSSLDLDDAGFDKLIERAHDTALWGRCSGFSPRAAPDWEALGRRLSTGPNNAGDRAAKIAAVSRFVAVHGEDARQILENAVSHWGASHLASAARAEDIARMTAFPESISGLQDEYYAVRTAMKDLGNLAASVNRGEPHGARSLADLVGRVDALYTAVEGASDFSEPRPKLEMMDTLIRWSDELEAVRAGRDVGTPEGAVQQAMADVQRGEALVRAYKPEEQRLFEQIRSSVAEPDDGFAESLGKLVSNHWSGDRSGAAFSSLQELYESWIRAILDLRDAYTRAGMTDGWLVSAGPTAPRQKDVEPDVETYDRLWRLHWSQRSTFHMGPDQADRAARYRSY
jgi:hypothetical protein